MNNTNIMKLRIKNKLSISELSNILDVPEENIRAWENDEKEPTITEFKKLSIFFEVSTDYLMGLKTEAIIEETAKEEQVSIKQENAAKINVATETKSPKKEKPVKENIESSKNPSKFSLKPMFNKWFYIVFPIAFAFLILFMALPCYTNQVANPSLFDFIFVFYLGHVVNPGMFIVGIFTMILAGLSICYFIAIMCLNKNNLAKLNLPNSIILGILGLSNFIMAIYTAAKINGTPFVTFCGVMVYLLWYMISFYSIFLALWYVIKFNSSDNKTNTNKTTTADINETPKTKVEIYEEKLLTKEKNQKENKELYNKKLEKVRNNGFTTNYRFFMIILPVFAAITLLCSNSDFFYDIPASLGLIYIILPIISVYHIVAISVNKVIRSHLYIATNIVNGIVFVVILIASLISATSYYYDYSLFRVLSLVYCLLLGLSFLLNIRKKNQNKSTSK